MSTFLSSLKSKAKSAGSALARTFNPSEEVSAARRKKVFGTESKKVAAAVIAGGAAAAIAAPVAIGAAGGARAAAAATGKALGGAIARNPGKAAVIGAVGVPALAGTISRDPTTITRAPAAVANFQGNVFEAFQDPSKEKFLDIVKENPVVAGLVAGGAAAAVGGGAALAASNLLAANRVSKETKEAREAIGAIASAAPASIQTSSAVMPNQNTAGPMGQLTTTVGRSVPSTRKRTKKPQIQNVRQTVRVNVINNSKLGTKTFISKRS